MKELLKGKLHLLAVAILVVSTADVHGQVERFYATPWRANEGDEVRFQTIGLTNSPARQILGWRWDFNGDGIMDLEGTGLNHPEGLTANWFATLDPALTREGLQVVTPTLTLVVTNVGQATLATLGPLTMTEHLYGPANTVNTELTLKARGSGNADLELRVTGNPRLTELNQQTNKFFAEITVRGTNVMGAPKVGWRFGHLSGYASTNDFDKAGLAAQFAYSAVGVYTVETHVDYEVRLSNGTRENRRLSRTNLNFVTVVETAKFLSLGRAYRRGFPAEYDWDDIVKAYSAEGATGDRYTYFHHLQTAYQRAQEEWKLNTNNLVARTNLTEAINELIQGQTLLGNKRLVEALRIKYPRLQGPGEVEEERLPEPPGVREETKAIDVALLDFQAGISMAFHALQEYGTNVFRSRAAKGRELFPEFPGYVSFQDPTLSSAPVPVKNELWQLTGAMQKEAQGMEEKAKKLFRLSAAEPAARKEAKEECKKVGLRGYLGMAVLAAVQSPTDFNSNEGDNLLGHVKNARDLFEQINAGLNPLGDDGSFIPNESFAAIYQDAQEAVADARESEIRVREEDRTFERYQADLRNELQSQRASFITPLINLTGLDPKEYNDLKTYDDQTDYRNTVSTKVANLVASYPYADPAGLGEYGAQVIAVFDAQEAIRQAVNDLNNVYERIQSSVIAKTEVEIAANETTRKVQALDIARGYANLFTVSSPPNASVSTHPGSAVSGYLNAIERDVNRIQASDIADAQHADQVRRELLSVANLAIGIRRAKNQLDQQKLRLDQMLSQMDRLIEDLANARDTASSLYFQDPSFRVVVSRAQRRAEAELDFAIDRLYRLAKTLEYEWTEAYRNPVDIPANCNEPRSLENPLFDKFSSLEDLFITRTADEAKDYLDALRAWDSKLRRINVTSVRGPNHAGPITAEPISLREDILGLRPDTDGLLASSVQQLRDYLENRYQTNRFNPLNPTLEFDFSTGIADNSLFPATGSRWNMRLHSIAIDLIGENGLSRKQVAEVDLAMSGMVTLRRFAANPPEADDLFNLTFNLGRRDRSAYSVVVPARINGATGGRPASEFAALGLQNRPIAATRWICRLDTENPSNRDLDFRKLKDIVFRFTYTYGNPPEFPGF